MQHETHPPSTPLRLTHHLQHRLLKGFLITSLGLAIIVAGFGLVYFQNYEYLTFMVIAFWIWSIASVWLVHRLLAPILSDLDQLERTLTDILQGGAVQPPTQLLSPAHNHPSPIFQASRVLLDRLANPDSPQVHFLELVSHELRSPLASVLGYAALMTDRLAPPSAATIERYAGIIVKQAQRMNQLIENILMAANVEGGFLELNRTPLRLRRLIEEVIEEARQQSKREILLDDNLRLSVCWGDRLRLREVFLNLIENALKYSTPETTIRVTLRPAEVNHYAEIMVRDQGIGIAEEELPLLFTRFGRIRKPQTQGIPGNGLGLFIVKHIVESHGGSIIVRSRPGRGTAFIVRLPLE